MTAMNRMIVADFHNNLTIAGTANTDYEGAFTGQAWSTGGSIKVPMPVNYIPADGATISSVPDIVENSITLTVSYRKNIAIGMTSKELTFDGDVKKTERFIAPIGKDLANLVEYQLGEAVRLAAYNHTGTAGTAPNSYASGAAAQSKMNNLGIRNSDRYFGLAEKSYLSLISAGTLQNSNDVSMTSKISKDYMLNRLAAMTTYHSLYVPTQVAGVGNANETPANGAVAAGTVKTTVTSGNSIVVTGLKASETGVFNPGDKITIAGVYKVNPISLNTLPDLMQFVITDAAAVDSDSSGECTITVSPTIISSSTSPYRNISNTSGIPATSAISLATANTGAGSTTKAAYDINIAYVPEAILFGAPPLVNPSDATILSQITDKETGISIRLLEYYEGAADRSVIRADIQFFIKILGDRLVALLG